MSGGKLPLTVENVMAEKDKVAEALLRGESYDPFGVAEMFEPAAAADAISAVVQNAPSVSASSGLEMQTEVELGDKDVEMKEGELQTKSDLPTPKSSEPDWELADPIPDTASLLLGQEEEDRAQFVFLSEWGQEEKEKTMGEVKTQLEDLTKHIQELSVGGTAPDDHGPHPDEPPMVAVEPAGDIRSTERGRQRSPWGPIAQTVGHVPFQRLFETQLS